MTTMTVASAKSDLVGESSGTIRLSTRSTRAALDRNTIIWWVLLSSISLFNIAIWIRSYLALLGAKSIDNDWARGGDGDDHHPYQRHHLMLSGIYVFACAYRSFLPRIDLERYCLWDTALSSIFLGRSAATVAEISFAGQIALFLHHLGEVHDHPWARVLAIALVPVITVAQCFCWCGVVTLNHGYHAIEESIWAAGALVVGLEMASLAVCHPEKASLRRLGMLGSVASFAFFWFMVTVDVPMYVRRWREGRGGCTGGREGGEVGETPPRVLLRMTTFEGGRDALRRRVVTKSWHVWKEETLWLTGYFSSAVWLSLFLIHMPVPV
jgi:hypothetical protein